MTKWLLGSVVVLAACTPPAEPTLELVVAPSTLDALGRTAQVRVIASNGDGTIGKGTVTIETSPGELDATTFELDAYGTARTTLTCVATDPACTPGTSLALQATWTLPGGKVVKANKTVRIGAAPTVWTRESCPAEARLIYLFSDSATLFSFHPPTKAMVALGHLACPSAAGSRPNSMAVSQDGVGWVNYSDGKIYRINVRTLSCTATTFVPPSGWTSLGMGFSPDSASSPQESLFIASAAGLARVDLQTMIATVIGPFSGVFASRGAELTGTTEGGLFGFFLPATSGAMQLARLDKLTATTSAPRSFPTLSVGNTFAYAFSSWGPDFYLYTSSEGAPTTVTKYSPAGDAVSTYLTAAAGVRILGAGVSRCGAD